MTNESGSSTRVVEVREEKEKEKEKDQEKEKDNGNEEKTEKNEKSEKKVLDNDKSSSKGADATQAKSSASTPSSRLKNPPKVAAEAATTAKSSTREVTSSAAAKDKTSSKGLTEEAMTQVAQQKYEAQEEKLRDVARHSMSFLRDFQGMAEPNFSKKVIEIRKALMKYEMQYVRVWELQDRTRRAELEVMSEEAGRLNEQAEEETEVIEDLRAKLEKEKLRKRRYESHEAAAAEINQKRTRTELQAEIDAQNADIEQLRRQKKELNAQAEELQLRGQLLRESALDVQNLLARHLESTSNLVSGSVSQAGSSGRKSNGAAPAQLVEVIS